MSSYEWNVSSFVLPKQITESRWLHHNMWCAKTGANSIYIPMQHETLKPARDTQDCRYHAFIPNAQRKQCAILHNSFTNWVRLKYFGSKNTVMFAAAIHVLLTNTVTVITQGRCVGHITLIKKWEKHRKLWSDNLKRQENVCKIGRLNTWKDTDKTDILIRSNKMQHYAGIYLLQNHSTCFGCPSHP